MQISSLTVDSLLPVANPGATPAAEGGGDFARSLREQQASRSPREKGASDGSSRLERAVDKPTNGMTRPARPASSEHRSEPDSTDSSPMTEPPLSAPPTNAEPIRAAAVAEPVVADGDAVAAGENLPVADAWPVPGPELLALSQVASPAPGVVPVAPALAASLDRGAVVSSEPPIEAGSAWVAETAVLNASAAVPITESGLAPAPPGGEVRDAAEGLPLQRFEAPPEEEPEVLRPTPFAQVAAAATGMPAAPKTPETPETPVATAEPRPPERLVVQGAVAAPPPDDVPLRGDVAAGVATVAPPPLAADLGGHATMVVSPAPLADGPAPSVMAASTTPPLGQVAPLAPPAAEVSSVAATPAESPAIAAAQPRTIEVFVRRGGQEPPVSGALPVVDGQPAIESLSASPQVTATQARPLTEALVEAVATAPAEVVPSQVVAPPRKTPLVKVTAASDTSDRRFAQLLGGKTIAPSAPVVETATPAKLAPPAMAADPAEPAAAATERLAHPAEEVLPRTGNDGAAKPLADAAGAGLPRESAPPATVQPPQVGESAPPVAAGGQPAPPIAPSVPAASTASPAPPVPPTVVEENIYRQVAGRISLVAGERHSRITMRLHPEELGQVKLEMAVEGDRVRIQLHAQTQQVQEVLEKYLPRLRDSFEQQGLKLDDVQVSSDSPQQGGKGFQQDSRPAPPASRQVARLAQGEDESAVDLAVTARPAVRPGGINVRI